MSRRVTIIPPGSKRPVLAAGDGLTPDQMNSVLNNPALMSLIDSRIAQANTSRVRVTRKSRKASEAELKAAQDKAAEINNEPPAAAPDAGGVAESKDNGPSDAGTV